MSTIVRLHEISQHVNIAWVCAMGHKVFEIHERYRIQYLHQRKGLEKYVHAQNGKQ